MNLTQVLPILSLIVFAALSIVQYYSKKQAVKTAYRQGQSDTDDLYEDSVQTWKNEITGLQLERDELKAKLVEIDDKYIEQLQLNKNLTNELSDCRKNIIVLNENISTLSGTNIKLVTRNENQKNQIVNLQHEKVELNNELITKGLTKVIPAYTAIGKAETLDGKTFYLHLGDAKLKKALAKTPGKVLEVPVYIDAELIASNLG